MSDRPQTAKVGDELTAKAGARIRRDYPMMGEMLTTRGSTTVQAKTDAKHGQWICITCGEALQNNMQAQGHRPSHKLAWWTGTQFEEP